MNYPNIRTLVFAVPICAAAFANTTTISIADNDISSNENLLENAIRFDRDDILEEKQDARAQFLRGLLFAYGRTVETDYVQAANWFQRAADKGYAPAEYSLGVMFAKGRGVRIDPKAAVKLFESAATKGLSAAQHNLAVMLAEGDGRPRDLVRAYSWFTTAGENLEISRQYRDRIEPLLSNEQITSALRNSEARQN
jgi:TPR repeat protein